MFTQNRHKKPRETRPHRGDRLVTSGSLFGEGRRSACALKLMTSRCTQSLGLSSPAITNLQLPQYFFIFIFLTSRHSSRPVPHFSKHELVRQRTTTLVSDG